MKLENSIIFDSLVKNIMKQKSFTLTGLTTFSRLLLLKYIKQISNKKLLFILVTLLSFGVSMIFDSKNFKKDIIELKESIKQKLRIRKSN